MEINETMYLRGKPARLKTEDTKKSTLKEKNLSKKLASKAVQRYIDDCTSIAGVTINEKIIVKYLSLIPNVVPLNSIIVGQNPYKSDILPHLRLHFRMNYPQFGQFLQQLRYYHSSCHYLGR